MNAQSAASESKRLEPILSQISAQAGASRQREAQAFAAHFFRHVPADDIATRDPAEWARIAQFMLEFARQRKAQAAKIRVFNPHKDSEGFESGHTLVAVATDDMPFLVDSVSMAINQAGLAAHAVIHPIFTVARDPGGHILNFGDEQGGQGAAESIMLFDIDHVGGAEEIENLRKNISLALDDVRAAVTDWPQMKAKMQAIAEALPTQNLPFDK
ncbi:MAG: NAD-glutamate dehydrogenase, partial [Rhodanobacteraceae bacterium]|nr:NAD-glutamate dehydrogenase [Rhodanobacteraceae bacterium]